MIDFAHHTNGFFFMCCCMCMYSFLRFPEKVARV